MLKNTLASAYGKFLRGIDTLKCTSGSIEAQKFDLLMRESNLEELNSLKRKVARLEDEVESKGSEISQYKKRFV